MDEDVSFAFLSRIKMQPRHFFLGIKMLPWDENSSAWDEKWDEKWNDVFHLISKLIFDLTCWHFYLREACLFQGGFLSQIKIQPRHFRPAVSLSQCNIFIRVNTAFSLCMLTSAYIASRLCLSYLRLFVESY